MTENKKTAARVAARYSGAMNRTAMMNQEQIIKVFDSLRPKQRVRAAISAAMGHGDAENGKPTEYIVGRRGKGRMGETVSLLPSDGSKPHPMSKITLIKRKSLHRGDDEYSVVAALGDMGATLLSLQVV